MVFGFDIQGEHLGRMQPFDDLFLGGKAPRQIIRTHFDIVDQNICIINCRWKLVRQLYFTIHDEFNMMGPRRELEGCRKDISASSITIT